MTEQVHSDTYPAIDPTKADLTGKAVYVSGASRGIGREIALSYAKAGASFIAVSARSDLSQVEKEMKKAAAEAGRKEPKTLSIKVDISDPESVKNVGGEIADAFGKLDILHNNAAVLGDMTKIMEGNPENWWYLCKSGTHQIWRQATYLMVGNVNVHGPYLMTRACMPLLLKGELKTIVNTASVGAHLVAPGLSDYQTSKLALVRFTDFVAAEHAGDGIIAFSIHPGNVITDMLGDINALPQEVAVAFVDTPQLCADGVVYLTKERREWLSGRYINTTWDLPELVSAAKQKMIVDGDMLKVKLVVT